MKHQALISEAISQLTHRFTPKVVDVKKAIDTLIDKDYLARKDGERDTYEYLA
jgi:cullin 1